jgi:hypothetical protein
MTFQYGTLSQKGSHPHRIKLPLDVLARTAAIAFVDLSRLLMLEKLDK